MSVIVEGPDGAGKTTLIRDLQDLFPELDLRPRFCTSEGGPLEGVDLFRAVFTDEHLKQRHSLYDRHPMFSEYIYSHELGRPIASGFLTPSAQLLSRRLERDALVILCMPPLGAVRDNLSAEEQMPGVTEHIDRIYEAYAIRGSQYTGRMYWHSYTNLMSFPVMRDYIKEYLNG